MKYRADDYEQDQGPNMTLVYMALIMSTVILVVVGLMFLVNKPTKSSSNGSHAQQIAAARENNQTQAMVDSVKELVSGSTLTSNQLDIWNLPDTGRETQEIVNGGKNGTVTNQTTGETVIEGNKEVDSDKTADTLAQGKTEVYDMTKKESMQDEDALDDGKHTLVTYQDGSTEWVEINDKLKTNTYDTSKFVYQSPEMKYFVDGKQASWFGVDLSSEQGIVDFEKLKRAGVDYVMIKVGGRGYSSGNIVLDSSFKDYMNGAKNAGLGIGVYFYSQAVDRDEIYDEADTLLELIKDYPVNYPVVFDMESIDGDMARTDALDVSTRTELARVFLKTIKENGYTPMLYGNKEWLVTKLNLEKLQDYDVWLSQEADTPDYPYAYTMWQYTQKGSISGISGNARLNVSLIDYSKK